jgi:integrase
MAGKRHGLSDTAIKAKGKAPGRYPDGESLYFQITERGNRSWEYNYRIHGRPRSMGLGPYPKVSLKEARELRDEARKLVRTGIDPIIARGAKRQIAASVLSVQHACESYIAAQRPKWKTKRHVEQIRQRLRDFVFPVIGHLPIADIQGAEARQVLSPIWAEKHSTAKRVRQYMEDVTSWATHEGIRRDESNPWEVKRLQYALPLGVRKTKSHPALSFKAAPGFLVELRAQSGVKAKALEFTMLCATRIGDICGGGKQHSTPMLWGHIDVVERVWRLPDTKMSRPFDVPLSDQAMRLLGEMQRFRDPSTDFVFPGANAGTVLNAATLRRMLKTMGHGGQMTVHGARSMFRTWAAECTNYERAVIEAALCHAPDELTRAYHRGDYASKRRLLMQHWADFLEGRVVQSEGSVVALRA